MNSEKKAESKPFTYRDTGVDIDKANQFIKDIKEITRETHRPGVVSDIGGFGAFFDIPSHYQQPLLVSGTDGVGTKLKLANTLKKHNTIGIDLVAMCVNDIICHGAEPLFFLDYYATGKLNPQQSVDIIQGIAEGCKLAGAALIGGETAEMPGMYPASDYDLAGFCLGVVEKNKVIDGHAVQIGDTLIGLAASGPHSNGYSLIRNIVEKTGANYNDPFEETTLGEVLLTPTRIYAKSILNVLKNVTVHSCANITGGGLIENIPRCLPQGTQAVIDKSSWQRPAIFNWLQERGQVTEEEMQRSLNLGVGMALIVPTDMVETTLACLKASGETAWILGSIQASNHKTPKAILQ